VRIKKGTDLLSTMIRKKHEDEEKKRDAEFIVDDSQKVTKKRNTASSEIRARNKEQRISEVKKAERDDTKKYDAMKMDVTITQQIIAQGLTVRTLKLPDVDEKSPLTNEERSQRIKMASNISRAMGIVSMEVELQLLKEIFDYYRETMNNGTMDEWLSIYSTFGLRREWGSTLKYGPVYALYQDYPRLKYLSTEYGLTWLKDNVKWVRKFIEETVDEKTFWRTIGKDVFSPAVIEFNVQQEFKISAAPKQKTGDPTNIDGNSNSNSDVDVMEY